MTASIIFEAVDFGFRDRAVLHGLSFQAYPGEFLAIVGPNGCGKSTTLKLMAGLHQPVAGRILIDGADLHGIGRKALSRQVALLTQASLAPPNMTVGDLVAMGRFAHQTLLGRRTAVDAAQIARAMQRMEVEELRDRRIGELSGGQLQRCRMAMALAQDAPILLLDEPTTYLDLRYQFGILEAARAEARAGRTVVAVLHDFTHASLYADRVAVMDDGRLARLGPPADVLTEELVEKVFDVRTRAVVAHGAVFHIPDGALK
ncbi:ABC transporter ATP-binding protein [Paracoccus laeviglucosivorans]|uniref:Iron complex transport system ATP-binding protein n=1 Tax=Paracoccus laeviglucosivorans TaxID=1197861 RepID=A0A521ET80_9RHOB|nr:ABC transporter ATP-binding protein [Paracoccus laeviglucosivorans]SMO87117.1 iron complex transport system ATP-binding protein [Paracoccus laeviglucosivorans]